MKIKLDNIPRLRLIDLLRRRRVSFDVFLKEHGITTYEGLTIRCNSMGVATPTVEEFAATLPPVVNSPQEGIVVVESPEFAQPITVVTDAQQLKNALVIIDDDALANDADAAASQKKLRKK